jgi:hypothetical protein
MSLGAQKEREFEVKEIIAIFYTRWGERKG